MEHLISATSRALERHGDDMLLACQHVFCVFTQMDQVQAYAIRTVLTQVRSRMAVRVVNRAQQTQATNSPSPKTSNNNEAVRHDSAPEHRESRFWWEPGSASNP